MELKRTEYEFGETESPIDAEEIWQQTLSITKTKEKLWKRAMPNWEWKLVKFLHTCPGLSRKARRWLAFKWMAWRGYRIEEGMGYYVGWQDNKILFKWEYGDLFTPTIKHDD